MSTDGTNKPISAPEGGVNPYSCFDECGSDDDGDIHEHCLVQNSNEESNQANNTPRDRTCGILSFHTNTESALLFHVRNAMSANNPIQLTDSKSFPEQKRKTSNNIHPTKADQVLAFIDEFCQNRHWMMHIGPEKGNDILIKEGLKQAIQTYLLDTVIRGVIEQQPVVTPTATPPPSSSSSLSNYNEETNVNVNVNVNMKKLKKKEPFIAVEMGTYCGYSSILLAKHLKRAVEEFGIDAHIYSVEIDPHCANVANQMIQMAELQDLITVVLLSDNHTDYADHQQDDTDDVNSDAEEEEDDDEDDDEEDHSNTMMPGGSEDVSVKILQESVLPPNRSKIDFLFLDHDKFLYLPSFLAFQRANLLKKGSLVVADNVLFAGIMDYVAYVRELQNQGIVHTKTIESRIEYWTENELLEAGEDTLRDGVGKSRFYFALSCLNLRKFYLDFLEKSLIFPFNNFLIFPRNHYIFVV